MQPLNPPPPVAIRRPVQVFESGNQISDRVVDWLLVVILATPRQIFTVGVNELPHAVWPPVMATAAFAVRAVAEMMVVCANFKDCASEAQLAVRDSSTISSPEDGPSANAGTRVNCRPTASKLRRILESMMAAQLEGLDAGESRFGLLNSQSQPQL